MKLCVIGSPALYVLDFGEIMVMNIVRFFCFVYVASGKQVIVTFFTNFITRF